MKPLISSCLSDDDLRGGVDRLHLALQRDTCAGRMREPHAVHAVASERDQSGQIDMRTHVISLQSIGMIWVGTSGYNYPEWKGSFYPRDLAAAKMLPYYAARFPTVEINYTFYRMPNEKLVAGWAAQTPSPYKLTLKAPRRITHDSRLKNVRRAGRRLLPAWPARSATSSARCCFSCRRTSRRIWRCSTRSSPSCRRRSAPRSSSGTRRGSTTRSSSGWRRRNLALCVADSEKLSTPVRVTADYAYFRLRDEGYTPRRHQALGRHDRARDRRLPRRVRVFQARGRRQGPGVREAADAASRPAGDRMSVRRMLSAAALAWSLAAPAAAQGWEFDARKIALGAGDASNLAADLVFDEQQPYRSIVLPFGLVQVLHDFDIYDPSSPGFDPVLAVEHLASPLHFILHRDDENAGQQAFVTALRNGQVSRDLNAYRGFSLARTSRSRPGCGAQLGTHAGDRAPRSRDARGVHRRRAVRVGRCGDRRRSALDIAADQLDTIDAPGRDAAARGGHAGAGGRRAVGWLSRPVRHRRQSGRARLRVPRRQLSVPGRVLVRR